MGSLTIELMEKTELILKLLSIPGVGRKSARLILEKITTPINNDKELIVFLLEIQEQNPRVKFDAGKIQAGLAIAEKILNDSANNNIELIDFTSEKYPELLKQILDPPLLLSCIGNTNAISQKSIAIVGTREPSEIGYKKAIEISEFFTEQGYTIVSGLALGCDTAAHIGCLNKKGNTIAVLAHGLQTIYPKENKQLAEKILASGGLLISEYFYGISPRPNYFIERDRIQAGMSQSVIVIETGIKGGTLHTVKFCEKNNRPVACYYSENMQWHENNMGNKILVESKSAVVITEKKDFRKLDKQLND